MKCTKQQCCQLLIIENSWKRLLWQLHCDTLLKVHLSLHLGEATIHQANSLETTTWFECPCKSFALFIELYSFAIAFDLFGCHMPVQKMVLHSIPLPIVPCTNRQRHTSSCVLSSQHYI